jgi:hypothetical protein
VSLHGFLRLLFNVHEIGNGIEAAATPTNRVEAFWYLSWFEGIGIKYEFHKDYITDANF